MSDPQRETTTQLTVRVVTGCLTCKHIDLWDRGPPYKCEGLCTHSESLRHIKAMASLEADGDVPPAWCPLRLKKGERLEVVLP